MTEAGWENKKTIVLIFNTVTWMKGEPPTGNKVAALKSYRGKPRDFFQSWTPSSKDLNVIIINIIFRNISDNLANVIV